MPNIDPQYTLRNVSQDSVLLPDILDLLRASFRYMDTRIDPPSSIHRLTVDKMKDHCRVGEIWVIGQVPLGCIFLTPKAGRLYLGKLAVRSDLRGKGFGQRLLEQAERRAAALGLPMLELETRIELTENHKAFAKFGFSIFRVASHEGYDRPTEVIMRKELSQSGPTDQSFSCFGDS